MKKILSFLIIFLFLAFPSRTLAKNPSPLDNCGGTGVETALGCIDITNKSVLVNKILTFGIGIGGGIAFLLILYGGFIVMTSQGDPKRLAAGQETITSALMGLIMLIFSVFILKLIGVDILTIPGWT